MRRQLAALAVAALIATAGCAGVLPGSDGAASDADPLYETPLDADAVADAHADAVRDAGSYAIESDSTLRVPDRNRTTNSSTYVAADFDSGAVFTRVAANDRTVEVYAFGNGTSYQRLATGGDVRYVAGSGPSGNASQYARGTVAGFVGLFDFSYAGTESADGATVHVYEAEGAGALNTSAPRYARLNESNVDAASASLRVRADGVVTELAYDVTLTVRETTQHVEVTRRFVDLGSADVSPPAWLDEARANTSR